jgi:tetratricopeptide (TPR) repeat protein
MRLKECCPINTTKLCLILVVGVSLLVSSCGLLTRQHLSRGEDYLEKRRYHEAVMEFKAALENDKDSAAAHYGLARAYEGLKKFHDTLSELQTAYNLDRFNSDIKTKLGNYYLLTSPPLVQQAEKFADEITSADPSHVEGHLLKASALTVKGAPEQEILSVIRGAIAIEPGRAGTYVSLARYFMRAGKAIEAEQALKEGIAASSSSALGYTEYGRFLVYQSRDGEAETQYTKGVEVEPSSVEAREALAEFFTFTNRLEKAEQVYLELVSLQENSPESRLALADFYAQAGRADDGVAALRNIVAEVPSFAPARYRLAEIHLQRGEASLASEQVEALVAMNSQDVEALVLRARLLLFERRSEDAVNDLSTVLRIQSNNRSGLYLMAQAKLSMGDTDQAFTHISDLDRYHPNYLKTGLLKVQSALTLGEGQTAWERADELVRQLDGVVPSSAEMNSYEFYDLKLRAKVARGLAAMRLGRMDDAKADLEDASRRFPKSALASMSLAKYHIARNDFDGARKLYDAVLAIDPKNFDALTGATKVLQRQGDGAGANARLDRAISANQEAPRVLAGLHYLKAMVAIGQRDFNRAESEIGKVLSYDENYFPAYAAYASLFVEKNQVDRALAQLANVVSRKPAAPTYTLMGMLEESRGRSADAETNYRKALEIRPGSAIAANNLAWMIAEKDGGNLDEAVRLAKVSVGKSPGTPEFYDTLGWVLFKKGSKEEAAENLRRAVSLAESEQGGRSGAEFRARLNTVIASMGGKAPAKAKAPAAVAASGNRGGRNL